MRRRKNRKLIPIFRLLIVIFICVFFSSIFALIYAANSNIMHNITINNVKVSGLSKVEAEEKFDNIIDSIIEKEIILQHRSI